jgi:hypothetical protein
VVDDSEQIPKAMLTPALLTLTPEPAFFVTGWLLEKSVRR